MLACTLTCAATASFATVPGAAPGCQIGTVTGSHHDGTFIITTGSGTLHVVPAATETTSPFGRNRVPSTRRQMLLTSTPAGFGRMNRCSSTLDFIVPPQGVTLLTIPECSTHVHVKRSIVPPGIQLSNALKDAPPSASVILTTGAVRGRVPMSPRTIMPSGVISIAE